MYQRIVLAALLLQAGIVIAAPNDDFKSKQYEVTVERNVVYGQGEIGESGKVRSRPLLLDSYQPVGAGSKPAPTLLLAFGGAFHRGSRAAQSYVEDGAQNTPVAEYCHEFARRGFNCFAIDYRLVPEYPVIVTPLDDPRLMPWQDATAPLATGRIDFVREKMGLPLLNDASRLMLWQGILAAAEDMQKALTFVRTHAGEYNVDPARIAIGGFSSGAITAINVAYGAGDDVAAVVSLSGSSWGYDLLRTTQTGPTPPLLLIVGQNDLPGVRLGSAGMLQAFGQMQADAEFAWVPGYGHFYPRGAVTLGAQSDKQSLEERITAFLHRALAL
ncbi:Uncharacterised protein [Halioglobus japonicus]|nr:Uncharacterised protein [Halioglobus japonicus]